MPNLWPAEVHREGLSYTCGALASTLTTVQADVFLQTETRYYVNASQYRPSAEYNSWNEREGAFWSVTPLCCAPVERLPGSVHCKYGRLSPNLSAVTPAGHDQLNGDSEFWQS
jgi:hypothetical protein